MGLVRFDRVLFRGTLPARAHPPAAGWDVLYGSGSTARGGAAVPSRPHVRHVAMELEEDERLGAAGGGGAGSGGARGSSGGSGGDVRVTPSQTPPDAMAMAAAAEAAAAAAAFAAVSGSLGGSGGGDATQGTPGGGSGGGGGGLSSTARQELQRRVEGMLWTVHTTPPDWTWAGAALPSRVKWVSGGFLRQRSWMGCSKHCKLGGRAQPTKPQTRYCKLN